MSVVGIDLAGMEKNPTGFAVLEDNTVHTCILFKDEEIVSATEKANPEIVAVDAPLSKGDSFRVCDLELKNRGFHPLPLNLKGMIPLVERGIKLATILQKKYLVKEIFSDASAKIFGISSPFALKNLKSFFNLEIFGGESDDEIDAIVAALTGRFFLLGKAEEVGDENGKIVLPKL